MRKVLAAAAVGTLVAGGALIAVAQTDDPTASTTTTAGPAIDGPGRHEALLSEALDGLVADGTLTQSQADAVIEAVEATASAHRAERETLRAQLASFWEDGVITAAEIAQLPEDHPLRDPDGPAAAYLEDGQITQDELRALHDELHPGGFGRRGHHGRGFGTGFGPGTNA